MGTVAANQKIYCVTEIAQAIGLLQMMQGVMLETAACFVHLVFFFDLGHFLMVSLGGFDIWLPLGLTVVRRALASKCDNCNLSCHGAPRSIMTSRCLLDAF